MKMLKKTFKIVAMICCILPLSFCKKIHSQERDLTLINPNFDKKLEGMLRFSVPVMSVEELQNELGQVVLIDARAREEFEISHIPGAKFGGYKKFDMAGFEDLSRDTPIVIYCSVGYRSEKIGEKFQKANFTNVRNLYGSIFEWVNEGNEVVDMKGQAAQEVHTYNAKWGQWMEAEDMIKVY